MTYAADISYILYQHGIIQSQFFSFLIDLLLRGIVAQNLSGRITGGDRFQGKDDCRNANQDRDEKKNTFDNIFEHNFSPCLIKMNPVFLKEWHREEDSSTVL